MGVSQEAYDEIAAIAGHLPSMSELGTLLAMWQSNGKQQSLYGWLRGQHHTVVRNSYLYDGQDKIHRNVNEPHVRECIDIAQTLCRETASELPPFMLKRNKLIYLAGDISTDFLYSAYGRQCLHINTPPHRQRAADQDAAYLELIMTAMADGKMIDGHAAVGTGGLFCTLAQGCTEAVGFDILTCREIRLDAFLFGEEGGRCVTTLTEEHEDVFLSKMEEAQLNCCFLGRTTKGRILVDGMDFGPARDFCRSRIQ
ncbi:MAG: phosphoribosylformylglycinamidine synthase [bacterium P3]|nr:MAG: phosphoribosylformylglycinamidine synthase [bacterium P201]KWW30496.1 MAG: phosphoribosylformylglycinamidine synthase [bacterium P3]KWW41383.1 MAG: phosphoribosylformylglycinamidine synthase [bacterium F083]